jgi:uncharacterized protein YbjT (DUF2867 family)
MRLLTNIPQDPNDIIKYILQDHHFTAGILIGKICPATTDISISVAIACASNHIPALLLVSSIGADSQSRNFYLRIKGETEDAVTTMSIPFVGIFQPSLLLGERKELRVGEMISQVLMPLLSPLLPKIYRPIEAAAVAKAMVREAKLKRQGLFRYTYASMCE